MMHDLPPAQQTTSRSAIAGIGFNTGPVAGDLDRLAAALARFEEMGCTAAEITANGLDAVSACRLLAHRVAAVRAIVRRHPLSLSLHAPIAINLMDEAHLPLQKRAAVASLELAAEIGATTVVLHPGRTDPAAHARERERLLALEREALAEVAERASALAVTIAYENISPNPRVIAGHETSYSLDPVALARQLEALGHHAVVACLDVSHAQQGAGLLGFDMMEACARLSPHVRHLHVSDSTGVPATMAWTSADETAFFGAGDMHAPPGWGGIDFPRLADALAVAEGTRIIIELRGNYHVHAAEATLAATRRFAAALPGRSDGPA